MPIQTINLGAYPNDGTGDDLRTAFKKINDNFSEVVTTVAIGNATNLGSGVGVFAQRNIANLEFKSLTSTAGTVAITQTSTTVNLNAIAKLETDLLPKLGANLNLNNKDIVGDGSIYANVWGANVGIINALMYFILRSSAISVDFGTFTAPAGVGPNGTTPNGIPLDMGSFTISTGSINNNILDFGTF
jgi:hypothetical protein